MTSHKHNRHHSTSKAAARNAPQQSTMRIGAADKLFASQQNKRSAPKESLLPVAYRSTLQPNKEFLHSIRVRKHLSEVEISPEKHKGNYKGARAFDYSLGMRFDRFRGHWVVSRVEGPCFLIASCTNKQLAAVRNIPLQIGSRIEQGYAIAIDPARTKKKRNPIMISCNVQRDNLVDADKEYLGDYESTLKDAAHDKKRKRTFRDTVTVSKKHRTTQFPTYDQLDPLPAQFADEDYYNNLRAIDSGADTSHLEEEKRSVLAERIFHSHDDKVLIVHPPMTYSTNHLVLIPKDSSIASIEDLTAEKHLSLVRHMESVAADLIAHFTAHDEELAKANPFIHEFRVGFMALAPQKGCVFHVLSIDFDGDQLFKKAHWNSLMGKCFLSTRTIKKRLKKDGSIRLDKEQLLKQRKVREYSCPKCGDFRIEKKFRKFFNHYQMCGVDAGLVQRLAEAALNAAVPSEAAKDIISALQDSTFAEKDDSEDFSSKQSVRVNVHSKFNPFGR